MNQRYAIIVTTINAPTRAVLEIRDRAPELGARFVLIGDTKSPPDFNLLGAEYLNVEQQVQSGFEFARLCPTRHYARKNIGYLWAMRDGADVIIETDDDNIPRDGFWAPRQRSVTAPTVSAPGWCNAYAYYSDDLIWPRGLPLDRVKDKVASFESLSTQTFDCPIQQGLADENPDVDAIYRLLLPLPMNFAPDRDLILNTGVWCPFNSQNTTFWRDSFPLLYLPYHCSFRMTDIWRSFIAQRLAWEAGWRLSFHSSTVFQERNEHDLMRDFAEEVPGYLNNERIRKTLEDLSLASGLGALSDNMIRAYDALIALNVIGKEEKPLLTAWLSDIDRMA